MSHDDRGVRESRRLLVFVTVLAVWGVTIEQARYVRTIKAAARRGEP